jgi:hypothetical protein
MSTNIKCTQPNFCIAPLVGTFATVDTANVNAYLRIKNSSGDSTAAYTFNPNIPQNTSIDYLDYIGPRQLTAFKDGMLFVTLVSDLSNETCDISFWEFDIVNNRLNLDYTLSKSSSGDEIIKSKNMALGRLYLKLTNTANIGDGFIVLNTTSGVDIGHTLYLGPSSNTSYLGNYEKAEVTSVSGNTVYITSTLGTPPFSYFNVEDPVTYLGDIYLFNEVGYGNVSNVGSQYKLDTKDGSLLHYINSALYKDLFTANYGTPFYNTVALIKYTSLFYVDVATGKVKKSVHLLLRDNTHMDLEDIVEVYALSFLNNEIYRLQKRRILRMDEGGYGIELWSTYNYCIDTIYRYVDSIELITAPQGVLGRTTKVTLEVQVKDQYGMGVSNKTVIFDHDGSDYGIWSDPNKQALTDINGYCSIDYTTAWYDVSDFTNINESFMFIAHTDGSTTHTGSVYVYVSSLAVLKVKVFSSFYIDQLNNILNSKYALSQINTFTSELGLKHEKELRSAFYIRQNYKSKTEAASGQGRVFSSYLTLDQQKEVISLGYLQQLSEHKDTYDISQTLVSRHLPVGANIDDVDIAQFKFILEVIPLPFSEKNNVNTTIWIKMAPYGYSLNKDTLIFKVREESYAGDTDYIDYTDTSYLVVETFDAGGGLLGLELLFTPPSYFHNEAKVSVFLEVYDLAIPANRIYYEYYFIIIPDYLAPRIINVFPERESFGSDLNTPIIFDVIDEEVGVDIKSLNMFVNNRIKTFSYIKIPKGYRITYINTDGFLYKQRIEVSVNVRDLSKRRNYLQESWYFYCGESTAPLIPADSFIPNTCIRGIPTRTVLYSFNIIDNGDGINTDSLLLDIGGNKRNFKLLPFIKRIN